VYPGTADPAELDQPTGNIGGNLARFADTFFRPQVGIAMTALNEQDVMALCGDLF